MFSGYKSNTTFNLSRFIEEYLILVICFMDVVILVPLVYQHAIQVELMT